MEAYLKELNEPQRLAVLDTEGPSLIIAGAGSGKTKVLTYRVAQLIHTGVSPNEILALTFTNKAAGGMKQRIAQIVDETSARSIWMGTFHSVFSRLLRVEAEKLGYSSKFTIYDADDAKGLIKSIIKEMNLDADSLYKPNMVYGRISFAKNNLKTPQAYAADSSIAEDDRHSKRPLMAQIYSTYMMRCKKADAMDFDDLLMNTYIILKNFPEVLRKYQQRFKYILVDEYQDTNHAQYAIINKLAEQHHNLCVVGDDAQSIYSFRGAVIENIFNYKRDYPETRTYKLERNYRSTQNIVNAANSVIEKNSRQLKKVCFSQKEIGEKIKVLQNKTDHEEGYVIAAEIKSNVISGQQFNEHAILYRTNAQSRVFEEVLRHQGIPYKIYGGLSFYQRKEIKDVISYLRLIVNNKDDEAFKRIVNYPARGIGKITLTKLEEYANQNNFTMIHILSEPQNHNQFLGFNNGTWIKLLDFYNWILSFTQAMYERDVYDIAINVVKLSGILADLDPAKDPENIARFQNVEELLNSMKDFTDTISQEGRTGTLDMYLETVSLLTSDESEKPEDRNKVSLMTIHSAKGLEFANVYVVGVEEGLFPSYMSVSSPADLEEERRLFYVAITRAERGLRISYALQRYKYGELTFSSPSRFISEIDEQFLDLPGKSIVDDMEFNAPRFQPRTVPAPNQAPRRSFTEKSAEKPVFAAPLNLTKLNKALRGEVSSTADDDFDNPEDIEVGMHVEHKRFGHGEVISIEGNLPDAKATVEFINEGQKQLLLKFAKLKIVSAD